MRISLEEFRRRPLRVHTFLQDVPLEDVWAIQLPSGGLGRTIQDASKAFAAASAASPPVVKALFTLRGRLGAWFGWDRKQPEWKSDSFTQHLSLADKTQSTAVAGSPDGRLSFLYRFEHEQLSEVRNATVHAFASLSLEPTSSGYLLYLAVYVKPVHPLTRAYMSLIRPFRHWIVYPALIRATQTAWAKQFGETQ